MDHKIEASTRQSFSRPVASLARRLRLNCLRFALILPITGTAFAQAPHIDEIQAYAAIAAIAQTASDRCPDILVNNEKLNSAPGFFHLTPDDETSARAAYDLEMKRLAAAIDGAPSVKVWCDAAYRAYGPDGDVVKGLLAR